MYLDIVLWAKGGFVNPHTKQSKHTVANRLSGIKVSEIGSITSVT